MDGKPEGFHNDLLNDLRLFSKQKGFVVRQKILPWTGLLAAGSSEQYDVSFTWAIITDDWLRVFDFAPSFATAQHFFVKLKSDAQILRVCRACAAGPWECRAAVRLRLACRT
ncbi:transporter substrate-binding domain-containing protein [Pseudomonas sp. Z1-14]|uniref:transporter substrate-binding domain-containing protein n=1 Tax=Pseudomonas sp. Z1-14 TaxID=2817409 RepID=UPI003DA9847B